jgi:hypothetical protein
MTIIFGIMYFALLGVLVALLIKNRSLSLFAAKCKAESDAAAQRIDEARKQCDADLTRVRGEAKKALLEAQKLIDKEVAEIKTEAQRIREHYEGEARKTIDASRAELTKSRQELDGLRKYAPLLDVEVEVRRMLSDATAEATALRNQARTLMEQTTKAAEDERLRAREKAKLAYEEADARLNQAIHDAGQIAADAEKRAKQIAGDAYGALKNKQALERAAEAMRNMIEGYGDRYLIPTHSLLDELAVEFGYTSAGESLKSARSQSRRMIEQGEAATCEHVDASRKVMGIRFVIDAFNGRVDAILSRVKYDNYGVLEQEIRDAFSLVNLNGKVCDARILPAYLDTRLAELKWALVVQELARKRLEEQRDLKARLRDEERARKEQEEAMRQAAKEEELKRKALEDKEREIAEARRAFEQAAAEDKAEWEKRIAEMQLANNGLREDLAAATERTQTIAQQTKRGHVYVMSNVGSFGEGVYKIGMTRRDPEIRRDELGDASVPFEFDIHAVIDSDNAPALERKIQKRFLGVQVNKMNTRKEFYRVLLKDVREEVDRLKAGEDFTVTRWTDMAAAAQFKETRDIENNPQDMAKWLKRQEAIAERESRQRTYRLSMADGEEANEAESP